MKIKSTWINYILNIADYYVLRWMATLLPILLSLFSFLLDVEIDELRERYPNWPGLFNKLEGFELYRIIFWIAIATLLAGGYNTLRQRRLFDLERKNQQLNAEIADITENIHSLFHTILYSLAVDLKLDQSGTDRVSIYVHQESAGLFIPCGRFSFNPIHKLKGRTQFSDKEGCIAKAWQFDWHYCDNFPDPADAKAYTDYMAAQYGMAKNVVRNLRMKPRTIAAKRISTQDQHYAVIVVESTIVERFAEGDIRKQLEAVSENYARMIRAVRKRIPDPIRAKELGF